LFKNTKIFTAEREKIGNFQVHKSKSLRSEEIFDKVSADIDKRETDIHEMVHDVAEEMKKDVAKRRANNKTVTIEIESTLSDVERKLRETIENKEELLLSRNAMHYINYGDDTEDLTHRLNFAENVI
jgi:Skp family chaperone for outer membrane proteins